MKLKIPIKVRKKARLALKLKKIGWKGMTETGINRAKQLAYDDAIDIEDIVVMNAWFSRHQYVSKIGYDKWKAQGKPMDQGQRNRRRGAVSWAGWGGDAGFDWINSKKVQDKIKKYKISINEKYVPKSLSKEDRKKQIESIFYGRDRPKLRSFKSKKSKWTVKADKYFKGDTSLSNMTKVLDVPLKSLREIMNKGKGAYYSGGSRPNQSAESWSRARLYSVLFGGPSRDIDKKIVDKYDIPLLE
eukprot:jgi/Bigna1/143012/aug1.75_g17720